MLFACCYNFTSAREREREPRRKFFNSCAPDSCANTLRYFEAAFPVTGRAHASIAIPMRVTSMALRNLLRAQNATERWLLRVVRFRVTRFANTSIAVSLEIRFRLPRHKLSVALSATEAWLLPASRVRSHLLVLGQTETHVIRLDAPLRWMAHAGPGERIIMIIHAHYTRFHRTSHIQCIFLHGSTMSRRVSDFLRVAATMPYSACAHAHLPTYVRTTPRSSDQSWACPRACVRGSPHRSPRVGMGHTPGTRPRGHDWRM
jgi:hypothetical protein